MASNSEAEKLQKQINVLSNLIHSHKQLKAKEKVPKKNYSWKNSDTKSHFKPDSNNTRTYNSLQTDVTSKQSTFALDRKKQTLVQPTTLVSTVTASSLAVRTTTNSSHCKTSQPNKQEPLSNKGKNPLNKCFVTWKKKSTNDSTSTETVNTAQSSRSSADTSSLSTRLSSLSSSIAAAKLKLQSGNNSKEGLSMASPAATSSSTNSKDSTYTWVKRESEQKTANASTQSISNSSSVLKWTKEGESTRIKTVPSSTGSARVWRAKGSPGSARVWRANGSPTGSARVWRAKGSLKLDRRKRSSLGTKQMSTGGFMKRRQKVVQKDTNRKNISSRYRFINSKRKRSSGSEKRRLIDGIPYKISPNKLQKQSQVKTKTLFKKAKQKSSKMLNISGNKYLMNSTRRTLKRVQPEDDNQPSTSKTTHLLPSKRRSSLHQVVTETHSGVLPWSSPASRSIASHVRRRSVQNALLYKYRKNAKSQQYCMFFNRFGKCNKGDNCPYIHDPSKIAVCTKFLQGKCKKTDGSCSFSHKIDKDKLPVCQFFLKDTCINDDCPYSHVNVSSNAAVCQDFIKGYCPDGQQCKKKHIIDCEEFLLTGKCTKGKKCNLMHRVRKPGTRKRNSSAKDSQQKAKQIKVVMTEEEGFLPLQPLHEPTVKDSSDHKEKVQAIAIKPRFLINKDSQG